VLFDIQDIQAVDIQESPSPYSRMVHPDKQGIEQRRQEVCMDEQGTPD